MLAADDRVRRAGGRLVVLRVPSEAERPFELVAGEGRVELVDVPPAETLAAAWLRGPPTRWGNPSRPEARPRPRSS
jgi:hypothetical protein